MKTISVCYVLSYYSPRYVRTQSLINALQKIEHIELHEARNSTQGFLRYFETLSKLIAIRFLHNPQYYILGFRGYEIFWIVRVITLGKTLIYDHMMSPYDSLVNERKIIRKAGWMDKLVNHYERSILFAADVVLTDTEIHKQYFNSLFGIPLEKIVPIPVGTDEQLFRLDTPKKASSPSNYLEVLYYGSFLPLHGMDKILGAALKLQGQPVHFTLIGGTKLNLSEFHSMIKELEIKNVTHIYWVEPEDLPQYIARSDLGLGGPFGDTGQAGRVITGKTFQFLAMAKPVVVGLHDGNNDGFIDKVNCLLVRRGDDDTLANAILWAIEHKDHLEQIGQLGYELYKSRYSVVHVSEMLKGVVLL